MPPTEAPRAAVLTISTSRAEGWGGEDESGDRLEAYATALGAEVTVRDLIADDRDLIADRLRRLCDEEGCRLVLTTGGTGFAADDVTPEATLEIADREAPGIAEAMRLASREHTPHWMLARNVPVIRGGTLIDNYPGSPMAIAEAGEAVAAALPHALRLLAGEPASHSH
jgi:molybdenum cofactor synthesis domain-containing protein